MTGEPGPIAGLCQGQANRSAQPVPPVYLIPAINEFFAAASDALFTAKETRCFPETAIGFACLPSETLVARQEVPASPWRSQRRPHRNTRTLKRNPAVCDRRTGAAGYLCLPKFAYGRSSVPIGPRLSDVSAYGTDLGVCITEDFWLIVVTEGNEDEIEIDELSLLKTSYRTESLVFPPNAG